MRAERGFQHVWRPLYTKMLFSGNMGSPLLRLRNLFICKVLVGMWLHVASGQ